MGGVVAIKVALARPEMVRRLVLTATSGGIDLGQFNVADWRAEYRAEYPNAADFVSEPYEEDLAPRLGRITAPTLLLWAADDPISPPAVGRLLEQRLGQARLVVLQRGGHMFARDNASDVAPLIQQHLA
jgi:pimeloyl-ACP methyl ester carboxylesterase